MTSNGFVPGPKKGQLVVGRDMCAFSHIPQRNNADKSARRREAELEALRIAMSQDAGFFIVLWRDSASVWTWDEAAVRAELQRAERDDLIAAPRAPEPLMQAPDISSDGLRLAASLHGFDGQLWRDGEICGSRWWRERPSVGDWLVFAESVGGVVLSTEPPPPMTPAPLARPWRQNDWRPQNAELIDKRAGFWISAGVVAAVFSGAAFVAGVEWTHNRLQSKVTQLEQEVAPVREAHQRVMLANAELKRISAPIKGVEAIAVISAVAVVLNTAGIKANGVEFRDNKILISLPRTYAAGSDRLLRLLEEARGIKAARLTSNALNSGDVQIEAEIEALS